MKFRGAGADEYEAHHAAATAIHDVILMLRGHYDKALENAADALAKATWDQPPTKGEV